MPLHNNEILSLPLLALRGLVVFPGMKLHFDVGRRKSIEAISTAMQRGRNIFLLSQRDIRIDDPEAEDLYNVGCIAKIEQVIKIKGESMRICVEGVSRASLLEIYSDDPCFMTNVSVMEDSPYRCTANYAEAIMRKTKTLFDEYANAVPHMAPDVVLTVAACDNMSYLSDYIISNLPVDLDDKQYILEQANPLKRIKLLLQLLNRERQILDIDSKINAKVRERIDENQREYYMREQMRVLSEELYGEDNPSDELERYREKIRSLSATDAVKDKLLDEASKLSKMPQGSHEGSVIRGYLDTCIELPWGVYTKDKINLKAAERQLEKSHYGLKEVKERILETLAVRGLSENIKGQVLCLVGPPGVGKTSIGKSVAECMGRRFARVSLGGVSDESEIRGHRRTYIGSMPGRIVNAIKLAGSSNPVILLDEIDKLCTSYHGDPSAALLEALDPEQNSTFKDHYIDLPYDLSKVLFITTANSLDGIPAPLIDRMEVLSIAGYTREDKFQIAKRHLISAQLELHGLTRANCKISEDAVFSIIDYYTRESGVRQLNRSIASLCRKAAYKVMNGEPVVRINAKNIESYLGVKKYRIDNLLPENTVGIVNGLAWTQVGGELMQLEVAAIKGAGKTELTGSLGDVMKESAFAAVTYVRSRAEELGIDPDFYKTTDLHIHATEAAVPKDGPSAGVTITTAIVSALTGKPILRDIAMTGEVTISGRVLPIGGLKEKSMAAYRAGVKTVFIPEENRCNLEEIDPVVKENIRFIPVKTVDEILALAFQKTAQAELPLNANFTESKTTGAVIRQ